MGDVSAGIPEISHLVSRPFGRQTFPFRLVGRMVSDRFFVVGCWRRGQVGGSGRSMLVAL